jgi:hypothetical protein
MASSKYSAQQQTNFAKNSDPSQGISLCIPRVFNNISWRRIKRHMIEANLGFVERVDVIPVNGGQFKRAFVHFSPGKWNMRDTMARQALTALQAGKRIKLMYEDPWFWLVSISGAAKPDEAPKPRERKVRIDLIPPSYDQSIQPDEEQRRTNPSNDPIHARMMSNTPPSLRRQKQSVISVLNTLSDSEEDKPHQRTCDTGEGAFAEEE